MVRHCMPLCHPVAMYVEEQAGVLHKFAVKILIFFFFFTCPEANDRAAVSGTVQTVCVCVSVSVSVCDCV